MARWITCKCGTVVKAYEAHQVCEKCDYKRTVRILKIITPICTLLSTLFIYLGFRGH